MAEQAPHRRKKGVSKRRYTLPPVLPERGGIGNPITMEQRKVFWDRRDAGFSVMAASKFANFSYSTGLRLNEKEEHLHTPDEGAAEDQLSGPKRTKQLSEEATKALEDFAYFQRRYFGRIATPWQEEAAIMAKEYLDSEDEEYLVVNAPPGSGKSTLFTLDLCAWITCRNRAIRGLIGSRTAKQASWYTGRLRRSLERVTPERAELMQARLGLAVDAETTMARDFGRFKPLDRDLWTTDSFIVMQESGVAISEKEPTWSSFGMDSGFLGGRYDIVVWDDVVDPTKTRTVEQVDYQRSWWDDVAETRLEPGGLLILQGQRIGMEDLYRYNLDKTVPDFEDEEEEYEEDAEVSEHKKYHHIKFQAHYPEKCLGPETHKPSAAPYPQGCLLVPRRLGWKKMATLMQNNPERFRVLYQQEDSDPQDVLVSPDWIWGKGDHPGCIDRHRSRLDLPDNAGHMLSVVSCDPSPTNNWAIEWWLYDPLTEFRYLIDLYRGKLDAPGFLDLNHARNEYTGIMEEWQARSVQLGARISHWIVEINAAQRFLIQYDHFKQWQIKWGIQMIPHSTGRNKSDPDYGVETIAPHYQFGRVRLPGRDEGMLRSHRLIDEVTRYQKNSPNRSDDCIMAHWFFEWQLPNIKNPKKIVTTEKRPSWLLKAS